MGSKSSGIPFLSQIEDEYQLNLESAKAFEADAQYNAGQRRRQADLMMGEQIASFGASGVELEGTPMSMIQEDQKNAEIEAMNIIFSGKMQSNQMKRRASLQKQNAYLSLVKDGAMMAVSAGAFKGGAGAGATTMKNGGGFSAASTGSNGFTFSGGGNIANKGLA